jgi:hypothetical protein
LIRTDEIRARIVVFGKQQAAKGVGDLGNSTSVVVDNEEIDAHPPELRPFTSPTHYPLLLASRPALRAGPCARTGPDVSASSATWGLVFAQKPIGLYRPEVLAHELVRLEVLDALRGNSTFFAAHVLTFAFVPHRRLVTSTRDPIPNPA